jgi:hypothetical protein
MRAEDSFVVGTVYYFGAMENLAQILTAGGFAVRIGHWALCIDQLARAFELGYVGNISPDAPFNVEGDGYDFPVDVLAAHCARLAGCLRGNGIGFEFTHISGDQEHELETYEFQP